MEYICWGFPKDRDFRLLTSISLISYDELLQSLHLFSNKKIVFSICQIMRWFVQIMEHNVGV
jgi:hypothetical protein